MRTTVRSAERVGGALRRHGFRGTARRMGARGRHAVYLVETHVWYALELGTELAREMPPGCELLRDRRGDTDTAGLLGRPSPEAENRMAAGGERWLVLDRGEAAFRCWIFPTRTPTIAAARGWLDLPPHVVCLEDSATGANHRGRGIAPAAWSAIAAQLADRPQVRTMITKVEEENVASRKAVEKSGIREVGVMTLKRTGLRTRVQVDPFPESPSPQRSPSVSSADMERRRSLHIV
jgi:hypothetical protein